MDECIHGLGPVEACTVCNGRDKRERSAEIAQPRTFAAKYEGQCAECNLAIAIGQIVAWLPGLPAVHEECWA